MNMQHNVKYFLSLKALSMNFQFYTLIIKELEQDSTKRLSLLHKLCKTPCFFADTIEE